MSSHHSSRPTPAPLPTKILKRLPDAITRPVVLLTVGAIALGGVTLAQSWMGAEPAGAVQLQNNWDGVFRKNQLWVKTVPFDQPRAWTDPQNLTSPAGAAPIMFSSSRTENGTAAPGYETVAIGPIFKPIGGGDTLHMVDYNAGGTVSVFASKGNGVVDGKSWGTLPTCNDGGTTEQWSGEVNQKNGYLYSVAGAAAPAMSGSLLEITTVVPRILRATVNERFECVTSTRKIVAQGGRSLNQQWTSLMGTSGPNTWYAGSDMAIDANGNLYLMLTGSSSQHALLRVVIPTDGAGEPTSGTWYYEIVKGFNGAVTTASAVWGMAFMDGALYTVHQDDSLWRWNPLSGDVSRLSTGSAFDPRDLGGAQAAPVIEGRVYNDTNGNGVIDAGEKGIAGLELELFEGEAAQGSTTWTKRSSGLLTNADGNYSALLNSASHEFMVRLKRPTINGANAVQTYASAGEFTSGPGAADPKNTLIAYCADANGDYQAKTTSGPCYGARADRIDALEVAAVDQTGNPVDATGGAAIVSKVSMNTDTAVVKADFGVTTAGSWGDAPSPYLTKNADAGPYANPQRAGQDYLYLGAKAGIYPDGEAHAAADAHPADDGLEMAPVVSGQTDAQRDWTAAQGEAMAVGQDYRFRVKASGDKAAVAAATVRAWISGVASSTAATTFDTPLVGSGLGGCEATPDQSGYVYCTYKAPNVTASDVIPVYARARAALDSSVSPVSRAPAPPNTAPWVPTGEVEDYQLGLAGAVVRLRARTVGSVPAHVSLGLANISAKAPSKTTAAIATNDTNGFVASGSGHAIVSRSAAVTITTSGVGGPGATSLNGWGLGTRSANGVASDTYCFDSLTGAAVTATVDAAAASLTIPGSQASQDITCRLTYVPKGSAEDSTVTAVPSDNEANPLAAATGYSAVTVDAKGKAVSAAGVSTDVPAVGAQVTLSLSARAGTGATATGARFQYSPDGGSSWQDSSAGQTHVCQIGEDGACTQKVRVAAAVAGGYDLSAAIGNDPLNNAASSQPTSTSPVQIWFTAGSPDSARSSFEITSTGNKFATAAKTTDVADYHTGVVVLRDGSGNPVKGAVAKGHLTWAESAPPASMVEITEDAAAGNEGKYNVKLWSSLARSYKGLKVKYDNGAGSALTLAGDATIVFKTRDAAQAGSSMTVTQDKGELANHDDPNASASTWGKQVITVTLKDSAGNAYTGAAAAGRLTAVSPAHGDKTTGVYYSEATGQFSCAAALDSGKCAAGVYALTVYASLAGAKDITVKYTAEDGAAAQSFLVRSHDDPTKEYVTAVFVTPPASGGSSVFVLGDPTTNPGETKPQDDWDDVNDTPDGVPVDRATGASYHANVRVWDSGRNNAIDQAKVRLVLANTGQSGDLPCSAAFSNGLKTIEARTSPVGKVSDTVTSKIAGACTISAEVEIGGTWTAVAGSPKTLKWIDSPADRADFTVSTATVVANGKDTGTVTVHLWDSQDLAITTAAGAIGAYGVDGDSKISVGAFTHSATVPGEYTASFSGSAPGDWEIGVKVGGTLVAKLAASGNKDAHLVPGPANKWWLVQPDGKALADGQATQPVAVHVTDATGNAVADGTVVTFTIPAGTSSGTDNGKTTIETKTVKGYATVSVASKNATGDVDGPAHHVVTASVKDSAGASQPVPDVRNAAEEATVVRDNGEVWLQFEPGAVSHASSWLVEPSAEGVADGSATLDVKVRAKDVNGNDVADGTAVTFNIPAKTTAEGVTGPGQVKVTTVKGVATIRVASADATADNTPPYHRVTAQVAGGAVSKVKDESGAKVLREDGEAHLVFLAPAPLPGHSWSIQPAGTKKADGQETFDVLVRAQDSNGNSARDGVEVTFHIPAGTMSGSLAGPRDIAAPTKNGYATLPVSSVVATDGRDGRPSYYVVTASLGGGLVKEVRDMGGSAIRSDGEVRLAFDPDSVDRSASWMIQPDGVKTANGSDPFVVMARVKDAKGNDVADGTEVTFAIPAGTTAEGKAGPANDTKIATVDGYATIRVSSSVATDGQGGHPAYHSVTASVNGGQIMSVRDSAQTSPAVRSDGQVRLTFNPGPVDHSTSWLVEPSGTASASGSAALEVKAHIKDAKGNDAAGGTKVTFSIPAGTASGSNAGPAQVTAVTVAGYATIQVTSTDATWDNSPAYHKVTATVEDAKGVDQAIKQVRDSSEDAANPVRDNGEVRLVFTPGQPAPGSSWLIEPAGSAQANGSDTLEVKVRLKDGSGNDAANGTEVIFRIPAATSSGTLNGPVDVPAAAVDGVATIKVRSSTANASGTYYAVTAKVAGADIKAVRNAAQDSPALRNDGEAHVVFGAGPASASASWLVQPDGSAIANGSLTQLVKAHVKDGSGNDAGTGTVVFHLPAGVLVAGDLGPRDVEVPVAAGLAQIAVASQVAAGSPYSVTASVKDGAAITTVMNSAESGVIGGRNDVKLTFIPGPVDAAATAASLTVSRDTARADGVAPITAYMTIQDATGNPLPGATGCSLELLYEGSDGARFGNASSGSTATTITTPTGADGRCVAQIRSYYQGSYPVKGTYKDAQGTVTESPGPDAKRPTASFSNEAVSAPKSEFKVERTATNTSLTQAIADGSDSYTVTVTTRDAAGGTANGQWVDVYYRLMPNGAEVKQAVQAGANGKPPGVASYQIKTTVKGVYRIEVKVGNDPVATVPGGNVTYAEKEFTQGPIDLSKTTITYSPGQANVRDLGEHYAEVTLRDTNSNLVEGEKVVFVLTTPTLGHFADVAGASLGQANQTVTSSLLGRAKAYLRNSGTDDQDVTLTIHSGTATGTEMGSHDFAFRKGGASPKDSLFVITPDPITTEQTADSSASFKGVVTVRDEKSTVLSNMPVSFTFDPPGAVTVAPAGPHKTDVNGQVNVTFTAAKAGAYTVNANVGGGNAQAENQVIKFVAGKAAASKSALTTTNHQVLANGTATHNAIVAVQDANGNPVKGQDVFFTVEAGSAAVPGPAVTPGTGQVKSCDFSDPAKEAWCTATGLALVTIASNEPGTFAVRAYLGTSADDANAVTDSPAGVQFSAGEPSPSHSSRTVSPDTDLTPTATVESNGTASYTVEAIISSAAGVLVDQANVRLVLDSGSPVQVVPLNKNNPQVTGSPESSHYGKYSWALTSVKAGTYSARVEVWASGAWQQVGGKVTLGFAGGAVAAGKSWLVQPAGQRLANGSSDFAVRVHALDANSNDSPGGSVVFTVPDGLTASVSGGTPVPGGANATITAPVVSGYAVVSYTAETANQPGKPYVVSAQAGGNAIEAVKTDDSAAGAAIRSDGQVWLDFTADAAQAGSSVLSIPTMVPDSANPDGKRVANGVATHTAEVVVRDAKGNLVRNAANAVLFSYSYKDLSGVEQTGSWPVQSTDADGLARWSFPSLVAADWTIRASIGGVEVSQSGKVASFKSGPVDPAKTLASFEVDSDVKLANGLAPAYARMRVLDAQGNPISGAGVAFALDYSSANGPLFTNATSGAKTAPGTSGADGWASVNIYSVWELLSVDVRAVYDNQQSAVKQVNFKNSVADAKSSWFRVDSAAGNAASPLARADGQDSYLVKVMLKDGDGNPVNGASATVVATPVNIPGASKITHSVASGSNPAGQATYALKTVQAGTWQVSVLIGGNPVPREDDPKHDPANGQWDAEFVVGPASATHSRLVAPTGEAAADGTATRTVAAQVKDAHGNAVAKQDVTFAVPAGVTAKTAGSDLTGPGTVVLATADGLGGGVKGTAELVLVSTKTGVFDVTAKVGGAGITDGSPAQVTFINAGLSLAKSVFEIPTMADPDPDKTKKIAGEEFHTPQVTLKDVSGNVFTPSQKVTFYYRLSSASQLLTGPTVDTVGGVALWPDFTPIAAGVYAVRAEVVTGTVQGWVPDDTTVKTALFVAGPANAGHSSVRVSQGAVLANDTSTHSATVAVRDLRDNVKSGEPVTFTLPAGKGAHFATPGCAAKSCTVNSSDTGEASVLIASKVEETVTVTAQLSGDRLIGTGDVVFQNDPAVAAQSSWSIDPANATKVANGTESFTATVLTKDANGLDKAGAAVGFELPAGVRIVEAGPYVSDASAKLVVHFVSTAAGKYTVNALIGTSQIAAADQSIEFVAGAIEYGVTKTFLTPPGSAAVANGTAEQTVVATVADSEGNPVTDAWVRFAVPAGTTLAAGASAEGQVGADGKASLRLTAVKAGSYLVTAEAKKGNSGTYQAIVGGSPAAVAFVAGPPDLDHSSISAAPGGPLDATGADADGYTVKVELRDTQDNLVRVAGTNVTIRFRLYTPDGKQLVSSVAPVSRVVPTDSNGTASTVFASTSAGVWKATAGPAGLGDVVIGSPASLAFQAVAPEAAQSTFGVTNNNVLANGQAFHNAWVVVRDANGNPRPGVDVQFTVDEGSKLVAGPALDPAKGQVKSCDLYSATKESWCDEHGKAMVTITSAEPGSFAVSASVAGDLVPGAPKQVSFEAGTPDASKSSYTVSPDVADASAWPVASGDPASAYTVTATVKSASGILVPNARVRLDGLDTSKVSIVQTGGVAGYTGTPADASYGTYTWNLYSSTSGTYTAKVQVDIGTNQWVTISPDVLTVKFRAGPPDAGKSWLSEPGNTAVADHATGLTVVAHVLDGSGNPADSGQVVFKVPAGTRTVGADTIDGPGDLPVAIVDGMAAITVVSRTASAPGSYYVVTATVRSTPTDAATSIKTVNDESGQEIAGRDGEVRLAYTAGKADPAASALAIPTAGDTKYVGGTDKHRAQVKVTDAKGNAVSGVPVRFDWIIGTVDGPGAGNWTTVNAPASNAQGVSEFEFPAPADQAVWVWVRAYLDGGLSFVPVGDPQTVVGARFSPRAPDPAATQASFKTHQVAVDNDLTAESWAQVVVSDQYGNGLGGLDVTFKVPSSQPGTLGTPVFVDGNQPPVAKTITVTTCQRDLPGTIPARCEIGGVYTPGLAYVPIVSDFEGAFTVSGTVATGGRTENAGSGTVTFKAPVGNAEKSFFTLAQTDPLAHAVLADGTSSYTVKATIMGSTASGLKPSSGACVAPSLPAHVTVKQPAPAAGTCAGGSFPTDLSGEVSFEIVTAQAGTAKVGVSLGGRDVPTRDDPAEYGLEAVFVGGGPSAVHSELISPASAVRADDPAGQMVVAAVRDAKGNAAVCWDKNDPAVQVPCQVVFNVPDGTWTGSFGPDARTDGPATVMVPAELITAGPPDSLVGTVAARLVYFGAQGAHRITAKVDGVDIMLADGLLQAGGPAQATIRFTDATAPGSPVVNPSDGTSISGLGEDPGNQITVTDVDGEVLCSATVGNDRKWSCDLAPAAATGDVLNVAEADGAGNSVVLPWRVGVPKIAVSKPSVALGERQSATGWNFQPGERVTAVTFGEVAVGAVTANSDGTVVFDWVIPEGSLRGVHILTLSGPSSGVYSVSFEVVGSKGPVDLKPAPLAPKDLPFTGADGVLAITGAALGLALAGLLLMLAAKRRRDEVRRGARLTLP
ncbi:MAG: Ig-like domain-containing protein [Bifidobacteriaceae bacterium]|jgi:hypothetical protein|nr:Ig-like domain-containing protein [Bifidobacteriaceae bacterium]